MEKGFRIESGFGKFALIATIIFALGCNRAGDVLHPQSQSAESPGSLYTELVVGGPESIDYQDIYMGSGQESEFKGTGLTLSNGMTVKVNSFSTISDTFQVSITYQRPNSVAVSRLLKFGSLAGASIVDGNGKVLFEYDYKLIADNQFEFYIRTNKDSISLVQTVVNGGVTSTYDFLGNTYILDFRSIQEVMRAKELYNVYRGIENLSSLSDSDQDLLEKLMGLESFFNVSTSFENNDDVDVVLSLITTPGFVHWKHTKYTNAMKGCGEECICGIATLISFGSSFLGPVGMALAMPAHGVSLACGIKGVLSAIF